MWRLSGRGDDMVLRACDGTRRPKVAWRRRRLRSPPVQLPQRKETLHWEVAHGTPTADATSPSDSCVRSERGGERSVLAVLVLVCSWKGMVACSLFQDQISIHTSIGQVRPSHQMSTNQSSNPCPSRCLSYPGKQRPTHTGHRERERPKSP
jgi:hypothetical protein